MNIIEVDSFLAFTLAIVLLFVGKLMTKKYEILRKYSIPEPVIGGFACAIVVAVIYALFDTTISFDLGMRDALLLYFFAGIGLSANFSTLLKGGKPLLILTALSVVYITIQNGIGVSVATMLGLEPVLGLMAGSISLIGGVGTTMAWAPSFNEMGLESAAEVGLASNTLGLIFACLIGGPIANYLIKKHRLQSQGDTQLDIGICHNQTVKLDHFGYLYAWLMLNLSLILGYFIDMGLSKMGLQLPMFVACLVAGILIGNFKLLVLKKKVSENAQLGQTLISDICLGMFLTMALMGLQLWQLQSTMLFIGTVMLFQVAASILFTLFVVFRFMGKDYESAVISSGFGGITLGSTATAIVNMTAVTQQYGAAHKAFIIVPLVCGFFIDIANALIINTFLRFL
ncbi:sodium/glutamate symporter [Vibrio mediterranei]|jgi:ESS family glutamate:Na+ symporter|uniref:Sodium/glutamate symporter n=1 Tax=Vibrio mediterranei TaxID=689 RepID=A0ABX5DLN7_9VIBR|nr:sodium/glutamate symporter [Vibrio mediterranei]MCG9660951.1 sodium/glutamate symporter [Vibrio mediterranei]PCD89906.1 sodium/glutamate symporter [Vibrio mediterranei]PRQ69290.1 sodium/glutamate symporter [Vibrio mediterranei]SBO10492.1 Sodium/glutamate symport carrier protein [Vibrio mediterranei]